MDDDLGWAETPWHIVTGCTRVAKGCRHCRGELRWQLATHPEARSGRRFVEVTQHPLRLTHPFELELPQTLHVAPGSDLFHDSVPLTFVAAVFAVMAATPEHTYQILTRRHQRMAQLMASLARMERSELARLYALYAPPMDDADTIRARILAAPWPLPNVWMGVVIEDQATAESGVPALLAVQAVKRSIHVEPLLGEIHLSRINWPQRDWIHLVDWVVVGSRHFQRESFPLPWLTLLQQECHDVGIPFMLKNLQL